LTSSVFNTNGKLLSHKQQLHLLQELKLLQLQRLNQEWEIVPNHSRRASLHLFIAMESIVWLKGILPPFVMQRNPVLLKLDPETLKTSNATRL
jgi:hypothetical protein